ncbi:MAG: GGDEF domain-containing protein [Fibromonadales bacterium]|nr:GGDEF domain-containing protein [Fibromonadales bacterium]MCL2261095.1 GGDEF domain-containing protein [Fibromonadales bacterium]
MSNNTEPDLFEHEQQIYDNAVMHAVEVRKGVSLGYEEYTELVKEYGKLLKLLRRATRLADRTTTDLYESNLDLTDKVNFDALTGIYNRRYMEDCLKRTISTITRSGGGKLSVLMLDVDHFKKYNDTYGHIMGDSCLKAVAEVLKGSITRVDDFVARYGGEEFVAILPNTSEGGAHKVAERILANMVSRYIPHEKNDAAKCVTVSIGYTTGNVRLAQSGTDFIRRADEALYMSKQSGRNKCTYLNFREDRT